MNKRLNML